MQDKQNISGSRPSLEYEWTFAYFKNSFIRRKKQKTKTSLYNFVFVNLSDDNNDISRNTFEEESRQTSDFSPGSRSKYSF